MTTASQVERAYHCAGSEVLPRANGTSEYAERGTFLHDFVERAKTDGRDAALERMPEQYRDIAEAIDLDAIPDVSVEVKLVYDLATDTARVIGYGSDRDYGELGPFEVAGTADLLGLDGDRVYVGDLKFGFVKVTPAERNLQLHTLALAACRAFDKLEAVVEILWAPDGEVRRDSAVLDVFDLDAHQMLLKGLHERVARERKRFAQGRMPDVSEGPWCRWCPAKPHCPAKAALVKRMAGADFAIHETAPLTPEIAGVAWRNLQRVKKMVTEVQSRIQAIVAEQGEIPLPDGGVLRQITEPGNERLDGDVVHRVLAEMYGEEAARDGVGFAATKERLRDMLRKHADGTLKDSERRVLDAVRAEGGAHRGTKTKLEEVPAKD